MPYIIHREGDSSWSAPLPSIRFVGDVDRPRLMPPIIVVVSVNRVCTNNGSNSTESKVIAVLATGRTTFDGILRTG